MYLRKTIEKKTVPIRKRALKQYIYSYPECFSKPKLIHNLVYTQKLSRNSQIYKTALQKTCHAMDVNDKVYFKDDIASDYESDKKCSIDNQDSDRKFL